jgi:hypothetical protein
MPFLMNSSSKSLVFSILYILLHFGPESSSNPTCLQCRAVKTDHTLSQALEFPDILYSAISTFSSDPTHPCVPIPTTEGKDIS